jgi:hypothetical protein
VELPFGSASACRTTLRMKRASWASSVRRRVRPTPAGPSSRMNEASPRAAFSRAPRKSLRSRERPTNAVLFSILPSRRRSSEALPAAAVGWLVRRTPCANGSIRPLVSTQVGPVVLLLTSDRNLHAGAQPRSRGWSSASRQYPQCRHASRNRLHTIHVLVQRLTHRAPAQVSANWMPAMGSTRWTHSEHCQSRHRKVTLWPRCKRRVSTHPRFAHMMA